METISPIIKNGALILTDSGDLEVGLDIQTQVAVAVAGYNCTYGDDLNSQLLPYLQQGLINKAYVNTITQIIKNAYQPLITQKIISNLQISVKAFNISNVQIRINLIDNNGREVTFSWTNLI